jgi:hypothetical protein
LICGKILEVKLPAKLTLESAMTQVFVDAALRSKLLNLSKPLELCDEQGKVVALVYPAVDSSLYHPLEPQVSEEELDRRERCNEKRFSTAEVLTRLEKLP